MRKLKSSLPQPGVNVLKIIAFVVIAYVVASTVEWSLHKYVMHSKVTFLGSYLESIGNSHITHHIATRPDMSLDKSTDGYAKLGEAENMCLFWTQIIPIAMVTLAITIPIGLYLRIHPWISVVIVCILILYTMTMWNTLHPAIHNRSGYNLKAPFAAKEGTFLYDMLVNSSLGQFLWQTHVLHHNIKKPHKTNFNVTMPLADFLYGTHSSYIAR